MIVVLRHSGRDDEEAEGDGKVSHGRALATRLR